jgi:hypothetical protein
MRVDFLVPSVLLLAFLSAAFLALASRAFAVRALALSAFDWVLLVVACELGPTGWKSMLSSGGGTKLLPAENRNTGRPLVVG